MKTHSFRWSKATLSACLFACSLLFFSLALQPPAFAQIDQGAIHGTVLDSTGHPVSGATVTLHNQDTNLDFTRTTNASGFYTFTPIKIGNYTVTVTGTGFQTSVHNNIRVDVGQTVGVNFALQPGQVSETVTVTATPTLQTEDASTGEVFNTQVINDTPLNGRNYVFVAQLTTGVAPPNQGFRQVAGAGDFSSNGNRVSQNNFVLDGVDNNANMQDFLNGATYAVRPPPDALEEFKVQSSDYSAELGRGTGAAINASIKSGTNDFHGSLWEYFRNDKMSAIDYFAKGKTAYHQNQFGATLGGPILKDKLFFFADSQGTRVSLFQPSRPGYNVPTAAMRNGDFSELLSPQNTGLANPVYLYKTGGTPTDANGNRLPVDTRLSCNGQLNVLCPSQINSVAQNILKLFPEPNTGAAHQTYQNYTVPSTANTNNVTQYDVRVDFNPSPNDQAFGRYSYSNNPVTYGTPLGILDGGDFGTDGQNSLYGKSGVLSETHFFTPTLSNEFRVGFNWLFAAYLQPNSDQNLAAKYGLGGIPFAASLGGFPNISIQNLNNTGNLSTIGIPGYMPSSERQNVLQIIDNVSKVWGNHTVKAGINFQHIRFFLLQTPNAIGSEAFNGTYTSDPSQGSNVATGAGAADFLLDQMNSSSINTLTPITNLRWYESAFVQDDWRVTPKLTLNLGLRWEYTQPLRELRDRQANFIGNYVDFNQGTGTYLIPTKQQSTVLPPTLLQTLATDHIGVQYSSNEYLLNPKKINFAPRIGIAYAPTPQTVFRAGGGLFYGGLENIGGGLNLGNNAPFFLSASFIPTPNSCSNVNGNVVCPTNGQTLETGFSAALNGPGGLANAASQGTIYAADQNGRSAYSIAYNASMQHSLATDLTFTISYQGNQSRRLRESYLPNSFHGVVPRDPGIDSRTYQPFHDFTIVNVANEGVARYDSLQTKLEKRFSHGFYFLAGYTWSHCLDDAIGPIGQSQIGGYRNPSLLGFRYDYGSCASDTRNRFTLSPQYELPFGAGKRFLNHGAVLNAFVGGWKTSYIFQAQSGNPIFLNSSNQGGSYPFKVGDPDSPGGVADPLTQPNFSCATKTHTINQWFNPCAFRNPPTAYINPDPTKNEINVANAGTIPYGPRGRVGVIGPGFYQLDMSLFKSFPIHIHESSLQIRADAFNILNHPSFANPGSGLSGTGSQRITSTRFSGIIPNARVIQVAARYSF